MNGPRPGPDVLRACQRDPEILVLGPPPTP